jgi:hypothetical protein
MGRLSLRASFCYSEINIGFSLRRSSIVLISFPDCLLIRGYFTVRLSTFLIYIRHAYSVLSAYW